MLIRVVAKKRRREWKVPSLGQSAAFPAGSGLSVSFVLSLGRC